MGVYDTLRSQRINQFKQQKLKHVHHFRGELGTRNTAQDLYLEGRDGDFNTEVDAIHLPDDSMALFQLNYVMLNSDGTEVDWASKIVTASKDGSNNISLNSDSNAPSVIAQSSAGTATERVDLKANSDNDGIILEANQDATGNTVFVHATLELLAYISTDLSYLYFQSN